MTARTVYTLPAELTLTPSQLNADGRFKVVNRGIVPVVVEVVADGGHGSARLAVAGDKCSWSLDGIRFMRISAASYPTEILIESTELPIELDTALIIGNTINNPIPIHIVGGGHSTTLPAWNLTNPGVVGNPGLTIGLASPPGPHLTYEITIKIGLFVVATYLWTTATNASTAGDGTGLDNFGAQPPLLVSNGVTYDIWAQADPASGNLGYTNGLTNLFDVSSDWPAGVSMTQVPTGVVGGVGPGIPFLIGSFTAVVP